MAKKFGERGSNRPVGSPALPGAGRPPVKAVIREGDGILLSQLEPDGSYCDLGRGHARIEKRGHNQIIILPQDDGSEIRIVIPR